MGEYWNPDRVQIWERMDRLATDVEVSINQHRSGLPITIHTAAPNPDGINADSTPDKWRWDIGTKDVDIEMVHKLLSQAVDCELDVRERPDGWEDGYWIVVENVGDIA